MIRMTRLPLTNWHNFQDDIIEFKNITYLLGVNAVGKTTIMDAVRYCLTTNKDFNTAGNKKSGRTLLGSVHQKQRAEDSYLRPGHTVSYIGIEFLDENIDKNFVIIVRIESETPKQDLKGVYQDWYITKPGYVLEDIPFFTKVKDGKKPTSRDAFKLDNKGMDRASNQADARRRICRVLGIGEADSPVGKKFNEVFHMGTSLEDIKDIREFIYTYAHDFTELLTEYKKLPYDLKYDAGRVKDVMRVVHAILKLDKETYIRNFSTALFKDSKKFQKEFRNTVESILFYYAGEMIEKDRILNFYNLYENPTYVLIKGDVKLVFNTSVIDELEMPDGIALSNASLEKINRITVNARRVITVENLTTYHDMNDGEAVYIYLGGYHNHSKQVLLEKVYADNKAVEYFHTGDLDVYGFLILENLKEKTGIPFKPLLMDRQTLKRFYKTGLYKELSTVDRRIIEKMKNEKLASYADVLQFMLDNDCKVEQESIKAVELIEGEK